MNTKKPLAFLLAVGTTLRLAVCSNDSQGNSEFLTSGDETGGSSTGAIELNPWPFNVDGFTEASSWEPIIAAFSEQNPDIKTTVTPINYQDDDQKLTFAIAVGTGPDIIFESPGRIAGNYAREGLMVDLSGLWETGSSDIVEGASSVPQLDGAYYMYPLSVAAHCTTINYEALEAVGALQYINEETRTWTTDNFVKTMEAVHDATTTDTISVSTPGIIYCGTQGGNQGTRILVSNLYSDHFVNEDGTAYTANSKNSVKALKLLQDMMNNGFMSANADFAVADELQAFANQTCTVSFCWNYANYTQYVAQTRLAPFAMAFPSDDGKPELEVAGSYGFDMFNNEGEARIEVAKRFVQFICDDQTVGAEAIKATGFFPIHSSWGDVYTGDAGAETCAPFVLVSDYLGHYYNLTGGRTEQRGYWWLILAKIMTISANAQTAVNKYATQINANIG